MEYAKPYQIMSTIKTVFKGSYAVLFVLVLALAFLAYYFIFSYFSSGLVLFGDYDAYYIIASAAVLAFFVAVSISFNLYAVRNKVPNPKINGSISSIVLSLVPSSLCCTSVIPAILASVAGTGAALYSGSVQGVLSEYNPAFVAVAVLILLYASYSSYKSIAPSCRLKCDNDENK